jgi:hypothetical protein
MKEKQTAEKESGDKCEEKPCVLKTGVAKVETFKSIVRSAAFPLLALLIPLGFRVIPEVLMGPFVVGFDPLGYYIPYTLTWLSGGVSFWPFLGAAPLLYVLLIGFASIGIPTVLLLKITSPILLGFLGLAVYFYANKTLAWSAKKSLLVVLFATLYFVALRVSWDMLRSELALIFLFTAMILLDKDDRRPFLNGVLLSIAMLLVVFAHQIVGAIMVAIITITIIRLYLGKHVRKLRRLIICSVPVVILFSTIVYADVMLPEYSVITGFSQGSEMFTAILGYTSYTDLIVNTLGFLIFCYLPLVPLLLLGYKHFKNNLPIKIWIYFILLIMFITLISANVFFGVFPYRLILLLTFPLSFLAAEGFSRIKLNRYKTCVAFMLATFSVCFIVLPYDSPFAYYALFPTYVPRSMLMNTVPLSDCQDTETALRWTKNSMSSDSRLLVHTAFNGWASLTINGSQIIPYGFANPDTVVQELVKNGSSHQYYLIWWIAFDGWFGQPTLSSNFKQVYQSGRIAVFTFISDFNTNSNLKQEIAKS